MNYDLWETFKATLPHKAGNFSKRNWGTPLHSLCSYQGKLKPALAYHLVNVFSSKGEVVLDPFSGSGTVPLEASINGRIPVSNDLSDMAVALSHAKTGATSRAACDSILIQLSEWIATNNVSERTYSDSESIRFNKTLKEYFEHATFSEVLKARDFFLETRDLDDANWCMVFSSMLHILHGNRPYALSRNSHPLTPYAPTGDYVYKSVAEKLTNKVHSALAAKESLPLTLQANTFQSDVRTLTGIAEQSIDVIITSPPFASSTRFYMTNWMRFWFCGWSAIDFKNASKNFIEGNKDKSLHIYHSIFDSFQRVLRPDGPVVLHVGKNKAVNMADKIRSYDFDGFELYDVHNECVATSEKHGIKDKGGTVEHQYLIYLRK